ncbi:MAG TPA: hypothetical protein P5096_02740 [Patescibacteria group bacterium]|nr:hypothetical protein [Patescibacteria group bacterium]
MKPKISFKYSLEKDAENWIYKIIGTEKGFISVEDTHSYYTENILEGLKKAKDKKEALAFMIQKIKSPKNSEIKFLAIHENIKTLEKIWKTIQGDYFDILSKILKAPLYRGGFISYLSTFTLCRSNVEEGYFYISTWGNISSQINIIFHEMHHMQFLSVYRKTLEESGLSENQIQNLKEALTFQLNEKDFQAITLLPDRGYPQHKDFRKKLKKIWDKEGDFKLFLPKAIELTKKIIKK